MIRTLGSLGLRGEQFKTRAQAKQAIIEYIGHCKTDRRHPALEYVPPTQVERRCRAEIEKRAEASYP
jgi:hypothetical protein